MIHKRQSATAAISTWAWLAALALAAFLLIRNGGVVPFVFRDEYTYNVFTRLAPMAEAVVPNYLYFFVFGSTKLCGEGFMECVHGLDVAFFLGAAPFIYQTCRRVAPRFPSCWVTILVMVGPLNSYTVYFMPEAMYFFGFWIMAWVATNLDERAGVIDWAGLGVVVGLMSLIKPHALFLLPALCIFAMYLYVRLQWKDVVRAAVMAVILVTVTIGTKFAVGYQFAGRAGVTLFGNFYSGVASSSVAGLDHLVALGGYSLHSLLAHFLAIVLALGLSLGTAMGLAVAGPWTPREKMPVHRVAVFTVLMVGSLVVIVSLFTGSLAMADPSEIIRLHQRYYDFSLPLCMICAAALAYSPLQTISLPWRIAFTTILLVAFGVIFTEKFQGFRPGILDGAWFDGLMTDSRCFGVVAYIMALCVVAWPFAPRVALTGLLYLGLPLSTVVSGFMVNRELDQHRGPTVYERAGWAARQFVPASERAGLVVICTVPAEGFRVLFNVDDANATFQIAPDTVAYEASKLPPGKSWVLSVGGRALPGNGTVVTRGEGYVLLHMPPL
ncbi:hypothetical protein P3W33_05450 [Luteibacter sp. PPL552]